MAPRTLKTLTQAQFARELGYARSYVTQLKQAGRLVITDDGKVDVEASRQRIRETADPNRDDVIRRHAEKRSGGTENKPRPEKSLDEISFSAGRAKEQHFRALQAQLDYEEKIGALVPKTDMQAAVADLVTTFRQELENLPHRISADLVGKDINEIRITLKRAMHDALGNLERGCTEKLNQPQELA